MGGRGGGAPGAEGGGGGGGGCLWFLKVPFRRELGLLLRQPGSLVGGCLSGRRGVERQRGRRELLRGSARSLGQLLKAERGAAVLRKQRVTRLKGIINC